jgi:AcrR family transcriptional regulator
MTKASITRHTILDKAFEIIYKKGYQTTSIDEIITTTNVTKGAFYYHFKTKDEMGLAIINEILKPTMQDVFIKTLQNAKNPIKEIFEMTKSLLLENPFLKLEYGCPVGNLTQEMTPWNFEFAKALSELILEWQQTIENCILNAKANGTVRINVSPQQVAYFVISSYWGIRNLGKVYNSTDCYNSYLEELKSYLNNLGENIF